jgi:hypothetical protein
MDSLVNHDAAAASAPTRPAIEGLNFQPVFSAKGLVLEYAVAIPTRRYEWRRSAPSQPARLVHDAIAFFQAFNERIPFSVNYGDHLPRIGWSAAEVCASGGVALNGNEILASPDRPPEQRFDGSYPASLVTFHAPLVSHLHARSQLFSSYTEFHIGLRTRLMPTIARSGPSSYGALRVTGLHLRVPSGFSEYSSLRSRFIKLLERADLAKLPVLVSNADHPHDLHWMRMFPDLQFQGDVLCPPLGADSLRALLALSGDNWRDFRVGSRYPARG